MSDASPFAAVCLFGLILFVAACLLCELIAGSNEPKDKEDEDDWHQMTPT